MTIPAFSPNTPIAIIGLGYVGLPLAVAFGGVRPVVGFDINRTRIAQLQAGHDSTLEVETAQLQFALDAVLSDILACGPAALAATKALMAKARLQAPASLIDEAAAVFSRAAQGAEAMEGMGAFLQKRKPNWVPA